MTIGKTIQEKRKQAKLTQQMLGEKLGVSASMIGQYENDLRKPKYETIVKIAAALGCRASDLDPSLLTLPNAVDHIIKTLSFDEEIHASIERESEILASIFQNKKAPVESDKGNRSAMEQEFIELYRRLNADQKKTVLALIRALLEDKE